MSSSDQVSEDPADVVQQDSVFLTRLASYSMINSTWNSVLARYNAVKGFSPLLKAGLETAEAASQMVGLPLIVALDQKFSLDQKAVMALDKAEKTAENLKATASNTKTKVVSAVFESKTAAENLIETHPRPFNQLLDVTEVIVNGLLPPSPQPAQAPAQHGVIERATTLGLDVSKRVQSVVLHISFRSPAEIAELAHVIDLIQYAAQYIDIDVQKARLANAVEAVKHTAEQAKENFEAVKHSAESKVAEAVQGAKDVASQAIERTAPVKKLIEDATSDLHDLRVRSTVSLVASLTHATEIVRQRAAAIRSLDVKETRAALQRRLVEVVDRTKAYTQSLNEAQLLDYINHVRSQSGSALTALIKLVNTTSAASAASSVRDQLSSSLLAWSNNVAARMGYKIIPVPALSLPAAQSPEVQAPEVLVPEFQAPEVQALDVQAAEEEEAKSLSVSSSASYDDDEIANTDSDLDM